MHSLSAVVLAAGEGRRLRPLTRNRPKPMLPAGNRPFLEFVLDGLLAADVPEVTIVVGHRGTRIQDHFGATYRETPITYVQQAKQLGSGHALAQAEAAVDDDALVVNGDQLVDPRIIEAVCEAHASGDAAVTLAALDHDTVERYGGVSTEDGLVTELVERPTRDSAYLLNAGVYGVTDRVFDAIRELEPSAGERSLPDALTHLRRTGASIRGIVSEGYWIDATYPWDLLWVARELFARQLVGGESGRQLSDAAHIHETAVLQGPVVVGPDAEIGAGAVLGPYVSVGQNVTIEAGAVVANAVLDSDTRIGANSTLRDCVTGQGVRVGPANVVTGGPGDVRVGGTVFEGESLGAVLADRVRTGGDVSFAPGTLVGPDATIRTGVDVRGTIEEGATVVR